jgi:lipoyl-dependent peroxiredoxin
MANRRPTEGFGDRKQTFVSHHYRSVFILETVFMKPNASAIWFGNLKGGKGIVSTKSDTLSQSEYFATGNAKRRGTNPCELIAAAHASCFSMTLANELLDAGFCPRRIITTATVTMEQLPAGWTIAGIQLDVVAEVPRADQSDFIKATVSAKTNCTISRLLNANIYMSARLEKHDSTEAWRVGRRIT